MVRWMQLGACYPLARNNCARDFPPQEPWVYDVDVEDACRSALEWRYRHLPYLYTRLRAASETGIPVLRPLFFMAPEDDRCRVVADEALFGPDLLIAPVLRPGKTSREVYLPRGEWCDTRTDETFTGPLTLLADAPLRGPMPMYARAGSVIPLAPVLQWSDQAALDPLHLHVYPDHRGDARGALYEDDGVSYAYERGEWTVTEFRAETSAGGQCRIDIRVQGDGLVPVRTMDVTVHRTPGRPTH
jgi:alpha-glucosidase